MAKGWGRPDLLVVDGGRGQLQMALNILEALEIEDVDVIGFSKPRTEHARGELDASDKIVLEHVKEPIRLPKNNPVLLFLQQIRDETHNTAVAYHQKRRRKKYLDIGIGFYKRCWTEEEKGFDRTFWKHQISAGSIG